LSREILFDAAILHLPLQGHHSADQGLLSLLEIAKFDHLDAIFISRPAQMA
jgi:hypothetical protein